MISIIKETIADELEDILTNKRGINNGSYHKDQRTILKELKEYIKKLRKGN